MQVCWGEKEKNVLERQCQHTVECEEWRKGREHLCKTRLRTQCQCSEGHCKPGRAGKTVKQLLSSWRNSTIHASQMQYLTSHLCLNFYFLVENISKWLSIIFYENSRRLKISIKIAEAWFDISLPILAVNFQPSSKTFVLIYLFLPLHCLDIDPVFWWYFWFIKIVKYIDFS